MPRLFFFIIAGAKDGKIDFSWLEIKLNCIQPLIIKEGLCNDKKFFFFAHEWPFNEK